MLLVHTAGMVDVGIDLAEVVKVPRTRMTYKITSHTIEGSNIPVRDVLFKFVSPQRRSQKRIPHLHVRNLLVLVQEVVHVEFAR